MASLILFDGSLQRLTRFVFPKLNISSDPAGIMEFGSTHRSLLPVWPCPKKRPVWEIQRRDLAWPLNPDRSAGVRQNNQCVSDLVPSQSLSRFCQNSFIIALLLLWTFSIGKNDPSDISSQRQFINSSREKTAAVKQTHLQCFCSDLLQIFAFVYSWNGRIHVPKMRLLSSFIYPHAVSDPPEQRSSVKHKKCIFDERKHYKLCSKRAA